MFLLRISCIAGEDWWLISKQRFSCTHYLFPKVWYEIHIEYLTIIIFIISHKIFFPDWGSSTPWTYLSPISKCIQTFESNDGRRTDQNCPEIGFDSAFTSQLFRCYRKDQRVSFYFTFGSLFFYFFSYVFKLQKIRN